MFWSFRVLYFSSIIATLVAIAAITGSAYGQTVRVGLVNSSTDVPFFIADAKGYLKDEGLNVEFVSFSSAAQMAAPIGTGELQVGAGAPSVALYNAVARGVQMKLIADKAHHPAGGGHAALLVRKDLVVSGKFKDFTDLRGLKVAVSGLGSGDESVLNEALKRGGLKWGDAQPVYMGFPQHPAAFQNGAIDASLTSEPLLTRTLNAGSAVLFQRNGQFYPDQQSAAVIYGSSFIQNQPEAARRFTRAYIRGARFYNDAILNGRLAGSTAPEVIGILTKYSIIKDAETYKVITPPAIRPDGKLNVDSLRKDWQFFKDTGQIDGKATVDQVLDNSFVEAALASLEPYNPTRPK
jgi:NitT/TauT family transport system substrate-binding protein